MQESDNLSEDSGDSSWTGTTEHITCPFCFGKLLFRSVKLDQCYKDAAPLWCYKCGQGPFFYFQLPENYYRPDTYDERTYWAYWYNCNKPK